MVRKYIFVLLFWAWGAVSLYGQDLLLEEWKAHLPYSTLHDIAISKNKVYAGTAYAYFTYEPSTQNVNRFSTVNGLSDVGVSRIAYSSRHELLIVAYENANLDVVTDQEIVNINDIHQKNITGGKGINNIFFYHDRGYLATDFGIVVVSLETFQIQDTYIIGQNGGRIPVYDVTVKDSAVYAATGEGVKEASLSGANLANFKQWTVHGDSQSITTGPVSMIEKSDQYLYAVQQDTLFYYEEGQWISLDFQQDWSIESLHFSDQELLYAQYQWDSTGKSVVDSRVAVVDTQHQTQYLQHEKWITRPKDVIKAGADKYWIADSWYGLILYKNGNFQPINPNGPTSVDVFDMEVQNGELWVASGAVDNWQLTFNYSGFYALIDDYWWNYTMATRPILEDYFDLIRVAIHPQNQHVFFGSYAGGILEVDQERNIIPYNKQNSTLEGAIGDTGRIHIGGLAFDQNRHLWVSNPGASHPLSVMTNEGSWKGIKIPTVRQVADIVVDEFNQKWLLMPERGVLVYDDKGTPANLSDDDHVILTQEEGSGNLPTTKVLSIAKDQEGEIWVGTEEGIAVFYCPGSVLTQGCDASRIKVQQGGYTNYLLETEAVQTIAVDGGDRKWVGTTNGVWLLSEDGKEEVYRFTEDNSPLFSDNINDIAINGESGEVYFGTAKGIISFKSTATEGRKQHGNVYVYPNPVRPDYNGKIAIKGLVDQAAVKVTDVEGHLVHESTALGGQAIWDGTNLQGERVKSGVYVIYSTNPNGEETYVTKLLIMN